MNPIHPERKTNLNSPEINRPDFGDKLRELLGVEFEEPAEMAEARMAILEALSGPDIGPDILRETWVEYAKLCEQIVDKNTDTSPQARAKLQIAALVHKALIFRESGDLRRYGEDLADAEEYAIAAHLADLAEAIGKELDDLMLYLQHEATK